MPQIRAFKYLMAFLLPASAIVAFNASGASTFAPLIYAFAIVPLLELLFRPDPVNLEAAEREMVRRDKVYDVLLYLVVPVQFVALWAFLTSITPETTTLDLIGRTSAMGLMCGVMGINVAHELGHRRTKWEQFLAKSLLLSSLYLHFFIEHNRGHHKRIGTHEDPATARKGENLYAFWWRTVTQSWASAWELETSRLKRKKHSFWSFHNEMLVYMIIQGALIAAIGWWFGPLALGLFAISAFVGILLLETVNYIEHYGLYRKKVSEFRFEDTTPVHSWNSDHVVGRLLLFELSRHSDHHHQPHKPYSLLDHHDDSPQLPTGYPGTMLLSLVPPLWFKVMDPRSEAIMANR